MSKRIARIDYSKQFNKQLKKASLVIKIAFRNRLEIFIQNPFHSQLNNHSLTGTLKGYRSINITGDWRAVFSEQGSSGDELVVIFEILGTHSQLSNFVYK